MKKNKLVGIIVMICFFSRGFIAYAQEWTEPKSHTCYSGIKVSVVNWGKGAGDNDYLWGVKFTNIYTTGVTFRYKLSIGEKITTAEGGTIASLKNKGDVWTLDADKLNAIQTHNQTEEWFLYIWDVCFEGMRCGESDRCYAGCDLDKNNPKPNQPCGLASSPEQNTGEIDNSPKEMIGRAGAGTKNDNSGYSGEYTTWIQEGKDITFTIGKTDKEIFWKKTDGEAPLVFKLTSPGVYRYDIGKDFMMIKFESENRLSLWNTGNLVGYFTIPDGKGNPDGVSITITDGVWKRGTLKANIKMGNGGILFQEINSVQQPVRLYKQISANEYKYMEPDGVHYNLLVIKSPERINYFEWDKRNNMGDYIFSPESDEKSTSATPKAVSAMNLNGKWKSDLDRNLKVTIKAINDDEFVYQYVVLFAKGKITVKRESENIFSATTKNFMNCYRNVLTYISNDRMKLDIYKCSGELYKTGELYRVEN